MMDDDDDAPRLGTAGRWAMRQMASGRSAVAEGLSRGDDDLADTELL